jgi:hypothetical protein
MHECPRHAAPTALAPFFFLHIPKSAGTSVRGVLDADAKRLGLSSFIPCLSGLRCAWFERDEVDEGCRWGANTHAMACSFPDRASHAAIVAGHFGSSLRDTLAPNGSQCITLLRHPLDRLISCYQFFVRKPGAPPFTALSLAEQVNVATGSCGGNLSVTYLGGGEYDPRGGVGRKLTPRGGSLAAATDLLQSCTVGLVERWDESPQTFAPATSSSMYPPLPRAGTLLLDMAGRCRSSRQRTRGPPSARRQRTRATGWRAGTRGTAASSTRGGGG